MKISWTPLSSVKKVYSPFRTRLAIGCVVVLSMAVLTLILKLWGPPPNFLPEPPELSTLKRTRDVKDNLTKTIFMFRGDFSSPHHDIFALHMQALKICDKDTKTSGCDVKLTNNYKYGNLTLKMVETIKMFCNHSEDKKTDFYVKIDDDLIMSPSKLDEIVRHMAATPCQFAGGFYIHLDFYYPSGQIYIFSRAVLDSVCKKLPTARLFSPWAEDLAFGGLVDSHDTNYTCSIKAPANHWHINYKDKRVKVHYYKQHND